MRGNLQSATEDKLGEDLATERRRLSPVKLPGLNMDASLAQQCLGMQPSERSKVSRAHSATEGSFKALQERQPKGGMSKESGKGGSPAEKRLLARRRLLPVKLPGLRMDASVAQQGLGMQPPERVLPATEGRALKQDKSKTEQQGSHKAESPVCKGHRRIGQEVCYLCMQQEERRLQAARREELARQERAEWAEHLACRAKTAALNAQRRHRAPLEANISKTEKKKTTEESRESLRSYCPTPPASVRRRQYDRELQERKEAWGKEPKRKPAQLSLQHHKSLPARQSHRRLEVAKAWWQEPKNRGEQNPCKAHSEEQLHCMGGKMPLQPRRRNH
ncbi:coiled-coil domain-containing protein 81-like [Struthio camelus]|uniref:coiled-coil domain-containing protein 81-like n=1 Tax=Struthio camelus TaxID=8801 RepID=UPI003603F8C0